MKRGDEMVRHKQAKPEMLTKKPRRLRRRWVCLLVLISLGCWIGFRIEQNIPPTLNALAEYECRSFCLETVNRAVQQALEEDPSLGDEMYTYDKDVQGSILAVRANPQAMSRAQLVLTRAVSEGLGARQEMILNVPVGTLLGGKVTAERGPEVEFHYLRDAYVTSSVDSSVTHAGINQTELDVTITFYATMGAMFGGHTTQVEVEHQIFLAQILLAGDVPQVYAGGQTSG